MSVVYNTSVVRDGLVLALDAKNIKSYSGGTNWNDVSGNQLNWTIPSSGSYNSSGYMTYINNSSVRSAAPAWYANTTDMTIECIYNPTNPHTGCCETVFGTYWFRFFQIGTGMYAMIGFNNGSGGFTYTHPSFNINLNQWHHCVAMRRNNRYIMWIDGVEVYNTDFGTGLTLYSTSGDWYISTASHSSIDVAVARIYNRGLSDNELRQNFNATRNKYGL